MLSATYRKHSEIIEVENFLLKLYLVVTNLVPPTFNVSHSSFEDATGKRKNSYLRNREKGHTLPGLETEFRRSKSCST